MITFLLMASLAQDVDVIGLRAGESAVELATPPVDRDDAARESRKTFLRPRVLDASTGAPIEGVLVEAWTEDGTPPLHLQTQIDFAITGRDGCVRVCRNDGVMQAEKVRFSKAGYSSRTVSSADAYEDEVPMFASWPLEGRVLDLEGRPVAGVIVRTRETCAHAVPASQTRTDALGRFRMEDFPPLTGGVPEVEVVGARHAPLYQLDALDLRRQASFYGAIDFYVARRRPLALQLVDGSGSPIASRRVSRNEAPAAAAWTDENGLCVLPPNPYDFGETDELSDPQGKTSLHPILFVDGSVNRIGPALVDSDDAQPRGRLTVRLEGLDGRVPPPIVIVPEGLRFFEASDGKEAKVPLGRARVVVGGDFTGFVQTSREFDITTRPQELTIVLEPEPRLRVHARDFVASHFWVQAGDHSSGMTNAIMIEQGISEMSVPAGQPISVLLELADGGLRRASLPPLEPGATGDVDLEAESSILRHGMSEAPERSSELRFAVVDQEGRPVTAEIDLTADQGVEVTSLGDGLHSAVLPAHSACRMSISAPGYTSAHLQGVVATKPDAARRIVLSRRSRLELRGDVSFVDFGGGGAELTAAGFDLDVAAGPLTLVVERSAGPPLALDLVLEPGETRRIEVR